jgi:hypothetical protein
MRIREDEDESIMRKEPRFLDPGAPLIEEALQK